MKSSFDFDLYIENAEPFARPILIEVRTAFHEVCPDLKETLKWGFPHFEHRGILAQIAAFQKHVRFVFWKGLLMNLEGLESTRIGDQSAMYGWHLASVNDLPSRPTLKVHILEAVRLNEENIKPRRNPPQKRPHLIVPTDFLQALSLKPPALEIFDQFSPSAQREYVDWITEAKKEPTRLSRMAQAANWISEGKQRNWKYLLQSKPKTNLM